MKKLSYIAFAVMGATALLLTGCGKSAVVQIGDKISANVVSHFSDGTNFESGNLDFTVGSGEVIKGLEDAVIGMKVGATKTFSVTSGQGYGALYNPMKLQRISQLIFDKIHVDGVKGAQVSLGDLQGIIQGTETDSSGFQFVLLETNPRQTWDNLAYEVNVLSINK